MWTELTPTALVRRGEAAYEILPCVRLGDSAEDGCVVALGLLLGVSEVAVAVAVELDVFRGRADGPVLATAIEL